MAWAHYLQSFWLVGIYSIDVQPGLRQVSFTSAVDLF